MLIFISLIIKINKNEVFLKIKIKISNKEHHFDFLFEKLINDYITKKEIKKYLIKKRK